MTTMLMTEENNDDNNNMTIFVMMEEQGTTMMLMKMEEATWNREKETEISGSHGSKDAVFWVVRSFDKYQCFGGNNCFSLQD
jgi:hypothetical protein